MCYVGPHDVQNICWNGTAGNGDGRDKKNKSCAQRRALREVAVADVTDMAPGRELFTHLVMHSVTASALYHGACPASDILLPISDCHSENNMLKDSK